MRNFYLILLTLIYTSNIFGQEKPIGFTIFVNNNRIINTNNTPSIFILFANEEIVIGNWNKKDSTFYFDSKADINLAEPYSNLIVISNKKMYKVPIAKLLDMTNFYHEFSFSKSMEINIRDEKRLNKFMGVFSFMITYGGAGMSNYGFYYTYRHIHYRNWLNELKLILNNI